MSLPSVYNHLVLPPLLPNHGDADADDVSKAILQRVLAACQTLGVLSKSKQWEGDLAQAWSLLQRTLVQSHGIQESRIEAKHLLRACADLRTQDVLIINLAQQNAALLLRRDDLDPSEPSVLFEVFETSPAAKDVLAAPGALVWDFPERAAAIPSTQFEDPSFLENLTSFLEQAGEESLARFAARVQKAGVSVIETRDTANPALLHRFLLPLLAATGRPTGVPTIRKRVRDDVNFHQAKLPWRRNPSWLVLRVALRRQLQLALGEERGRLCYKFFISVVLAQLLRDCAGHITPELTLTLRAKLCRRLAKLELEKSHLSASTSEQVYAHLIDTIGALCRDTIETTTKQIETAWDSYRSRVTRRVPRLSSHANEQALVLSLPTSGQYLNSLLTITSSNRAKGVSLEVPSLDDSTIKAARKLARSYFNLTRLDMSGRDRKALTGDHSKSYPDRCIQMANVIDIAFSKVLAICVSKPDQMSSFILNMLETWVTMDECATTACPILKDFHPVFPPAVLDVLLLSTTDELRRLQAVQAYLNDRCNDCLSPTRTIFSNPDDESFASRYLQDSVEAQKLHDLMERIALDCNSSRDRKKREWRRLCDEYDEHSALISSTACVCTWNDDGSRNVKGCNRCYHLRVRKRMKIDIHEDYLPAKHPSRAAVVFELAIPRYLQAYRNATWRIFSELAHPSRPTSQATANLLLKNYSQLQQYSRSHARGVSLASVEKTFAQTHYKEMSMKVDLDDVVLPLAAKFLYYDEVSKTWTGKLQGAITFAHHCHSYIPRSLSDSVVKLPEHPPPCIDGPTSYETIAHQTKCPPEISVHEFAALQRLLAGNNRRWMTLLVELGSSNLNFSAEHTMRLFEHLASQAGPAQQTRHVLRDVHVIFRDNHFCQRLAQQIETRFRTIRTNWRETHCMELLLTLALRLHEFADDMARDRALSIIKQVRDATLDWVSRLRDDVRNANDDATAMRMANYAFWAALLCRRTYAAFDSTEDVMSAAELSSFVQASIALQESLVINPSALPPTLASMFMRDMKMAYRLRHLVRNSLLAHPGSMSEGISMSWLKSPSSPSMTFTKWRFLSTPHETWVVATMTSVQQDWVQDQVIHYDTIEGYLLVDGMPLGRLPPEIMNSDEVSQLFGNRHLLTFPSSLRDMSYVTRFDGNEIHFGQRGGKTVIRTFSGSERILEFVPPSVFRKGSDFDLPASLIDNCTHWLNLLTRQLEIRRKPCLWLTREGDWVIDLTTRRAKRRESYLVDPHSATCRHIGDIFDGFEDLQHLAVFQPAKGRLTVHLRRMELTFYVNANNLLESRQLRAEIDPDQDAGALYGFNSKLVVRDVVNSERRSVLAVLGPLAYRRQGMHVEIRAIFESGYGRYEIDNILGRLTCLPEPRLLYTKALLHAMTSFALPDPLTGCTGTEEALRTLRSGACQPWAPLQILVKLILKQIAALSPVREYYPKDMRSLQTVHWQSNLTMAVQHDCLQLAVSDILLKSNQLLEFTEKKDAWEEIAERGHLSDRGLARRILYERPLSDAADQICGQDRKYKGADRQKFEEQEANVYRICNLLRQRPFTIKPPIDFPLMLQNLPGKFIGGYHDSEPQSTLHDWIEGNLGERWGSLVTFSRAIAPHDWYKAAFRLGLLTFNRAVEMKTIETLCAFSSVEELKVVGLPDHPVFAEFQVDWNLKQEHLEKFINPSGPTSYPERHHRSTRRNHVITEDPKRIETERLARHLLQQWPCETPSMSTFEFDLLDVDEVMERVKPEWTRLYANKQLLDHAEEVQKILAVHMGNANLAVMRNWPLNDIGSCAWTRVAAVPSLSKELILKPADKLPDNIAGPEVDLQSIHVAREGVSAPDEISSSISELDGILSTFVDSPKHLWAQYGSDLMESLNALRCINRGKQAGGVAAAPDLKDVNQDIARAQEAVRRKMLLISSTLSANDDRFRWLSLGQMWPRVTAISALETLRSGGYGFGEGMKVLLVSYGLSITKLQWLLRLKDHYLRHENQKLIEEWSEKGHINWDPLSFPEWLLFEIDSNLLIRGEQIDVAGAIISPSSSSNSVMQLNMGKGKTSCIVPLALTVLANTKQLSRLIVPRALLLQTAQTLQARIGGLVGREITHIPFSRRTRTTENLLELYSELHYQMLHKSGVILSIPEHILSFKLSGLQRLADSKLDEARAMVEFQTWLEANSRDVLDECDVSLAVKTQLIYPSGQLMPVDGHPTRWVTTQTVLGLVQQHITHTRKLFPRGIEVISNSAGFPKIHILQSDVEDHLIRELVNDICNGNTPLLQIPGRLSPTLKDELRQVLSEERPDQKLFKKVTRGLKKVDSSAVKTILQVRGLLVHRILFLCLRKRWHVQYGLHPHRHPIAVPFEAKGVPSEQAEFGHPDVVILFTCLAYYHAGLSASQLKESLGHILRSDDPASEYDRWTAGSKSLPDALRHWNVINVDDSGQVEELLRHLRFNTTVLNHYMNVFVFPVHAKQFTIKLQSSGWDLPLIAPDPAYEGARTTGFSGTNDNQRLLPLTIRQDDLPTLSQTNAEVLTYLLQSRNRRYQVAATRGVRWDEEHLLRHLGRNKIRVLIDAGAAILELKNEDVASLWLSIDNEAKAAVYFGSNDNRAWVRYRGAKESVPLLATPFANDMESCLVYLDEAHTRGTDLKLPRTACGAVTLALGQTKDHTVQAAMRLRQLATTQSVVFFAPPEVHQSIMDVCNKRPTQIIESADVIRWLLEQTCRGNEQLQTLHNAQGSEFCRRMNSLWEYPDFLINEAQRTALLKVIELPERLTLEEQYGMGTNIGPGIENQRKALQNVSHPGLQQIAEGLQKVDSSIDHCGQVFRDLTMQEVEQEREVEFQVEEIREVQKPKHHKALQFPGLHPAISRLVDKGDVRGIKVFETASSFLSRTCIGKKYELVARECRLLLSPEFSRTIRAKTTELDDAFLRPVEYVVWEKSTKTAMVVIPEEAELIIPMLRAAMSPRVNLITYAAPTTKNMFHFCKLDYYVLPHWPKDYVLPQWLSIHLGVLGARLYFNFAEYEALKEYVEPSVADEESTTKFRAFLFDWLAVQHKTQDITMTPMGYLCKGKPLHKDHPFFNAGEISDGGAEVAIGENDDGDEKVIGKGLTMPAMVNGSEYKCEVE